MDRFTILLVEDDSNLRDLLTQTIEMEWPWINILTAVNGREALLQLSKATYTGSLPDLIITDYMMPVMNGVELAQAIRSHITYNKLPIVIMSAFNVKDLCSSFNLEFYPKPIDILVLIESLNNYLFKKSPELVEV